jgi:LemA protein
VAEAYPQLRANENFLALQEELTSTESKIAFARQFYNDQVMRLNTVIQQFPSVIVARLTGFREREFFETEEDSRGAVAVDI